MEVFDVLINRFIDGRSACYLAILPTGPNSALVSLVNDEGAAAGPYASLTLPGTEVIQNSQCSVADAGSSISASGNTVTVTLAITFKPSFFGSKLVYLAAQSSAIGNSAWRFAGVWNVPGISSLGVGPGIQVYGFDNEPEYFFTFSDASGISASNVMNILINNSLDGRRACYLAFIPAVAGNSGTLYLVDDAGDSGGPYAALPLPGPGTISNSHCAIIGAGSSVSRIGNSLVLGLHLSFSNFAGYPIIYQAARNSVDNSGWQPVGSISVPNLEAEVPDVLYGGFSPPHLQRSVGLFLLAVANHTQLDSLTLSLSGVGLTGDGQIGSFSNSADILIDLPPGTYTLALTSNPSWGPLQIVIR